MCKRQRVLLPWGSLPEWCSLFSVAAWLCLRVLNSPQKNTSFPSTPQDLLWWDRTQLLKSSQDKHYKPPSGGGVRVIAGPGRKLGIWAATLPAKNPGGRDSRPTLTSGGHNPPGGGNPSSLQKAGARENNPGAVSPGSHRRGHLAFLLAAAMIKTLTGKF